jgi:RNA polymerase subunit RPABC4/transcription elongation factor Spt4
VRTCSKCNALNSDSADTCKNCRANLNEFSTSAVALKKFQDNPRVLTVLLATYDDTCPACREVQGTYDKDKVPTLPVVGCSHKNGCRCYYQPILSDIYP